MDVGFYSCTHHDLYECQDRISNGAIIVCHDVSRLYVKMHDKILPMTPKWNKQPKYTLRKCVCCGAPLPATDCFIIKCEYCGNVYDADDEMEI